MRITVLAWLEVGVHSVPLRHRQVAGAENQRVQARAGRRDLLGARDPGDVLDQEALDAYTATKTVVVQL